MSLNIYICQNQKEKGFLACLEGHHLHIMLFEIRVFKFFYYFLYFAKRLKTINEKKNYERSRKDKKGNY